MLCHAVLSIVFQFSSVQSFDGLGYRGDTTDDSAEILFHSFLQEAPVGSSDMGMMSTL